MKKLITILMFLSLTVVGFGQILAPKGIKYKGALLRPAVASITVAATDATASEKAQADYICDGTNDEVQWALANTAAAGGIVKLLGLTFNLQNSVTLTSQFEGSRSVSNIIGTQINVSDTKQIICHYPGNITNARIAVATRSTMVPVVLLESIAGTTSYDGISNLLENLLVTCSDATGVGVQIRASSSATTQYISFCTFPTLVIKHFKTNLSIKGREPGGSAFVNSNTFGSLMLTDADTMIVLNVTGTAEVQANIFNAITMQCQANTLVGIYLTDRTSYNQFPTVYAMDWTAVPSVKIANGSELIGVYAYGSLPNIDWGDNIGDMGYNDIRTTSNPSRYVDGGTVIIAGNVLNLTLGAGQYLVEGEGGASDVIAEMYGCIVGQKVMLRRKTAGHDIRVTTYLSYMTTDYMLTNANDFIELTCVGVGYWIVNRYFSSTGMDNLNVTASADGLGSGILPDGAKNITVTSASINNIVALPAAGANTVGCVITGQVGANGFSLRVQAAQLTTVYLNGVTTNKEAAIPASTSFEIRCIDATHWILKDWTALGAVTTAIVPAAL